MTALTLTREAAKKILDKRIDQRVSKYKARGRRDAEGIYWASKREEKAWHELKIRERKGEIWQLKRQVPFELCVPIQRGEGVAHVADIVIDFIFIENSKLRAQDSKGVRTPLFKLKKKMFEAQYGILLEEI